MRAEKYRGSKERDIAEEKKKTVFFNKARRRFIRSQVVRAVKGP